MEDYTILYPPAKDRQSEPLLVKDSTTGLCNIS